MPLLPGYSMEPWLIAVILKPLGILLLFVAIVYPLRNVLARAIPEGRVKQFLYRERTRESASKRDKKIMTLAVILSYVLLAAFGFLVVTIGG